MPISGQNITGSDEDNTDSTGIRGGTDAAIIGNVGDRLKVDASFSSVTIGQGTPMPVIEMPLKYEDMNASNGGIARDTSVGQAYVTVYSKTGSGLFLGFLLTLENQNDDWSIRFTIDSTVVFELTTKELNANDIYNFDKLGKDFDESFLGIYYGDKTFRWVSPQNTGLIYNSSILVEIKRNKPSPETRKFRAGLAVRTTN